MKEKFMLFVGDDHYPEGGWNDWVGNFDKLEAAQKMAASLSADFDWWHIVDANGGIVAQGTKR